MANRLEMAIIQAILRLHSAGWSQRAIARRLGVDRETVAKTVRQAHSEPKPANAPSGSESPKPATFSLAPAPPASARAAGEAPAGHQPSEPDSKPAIAPSGSDARVRSTIDPTGPPADATAPAGTSPARCGRPSACEPFRALILAKLEQELTAQRIYQDLLEERGYSGSYYSVRRFVQKLGYPFLPDERELFV